MEDNDCLICFEDLDSKDKAILSCNHVIHYSCLQQWIKRRKTVKQLCPICNNDGEIINIIDAKPIFKDTSLQYINPNINPNPPKNFNTNNNTNIRSNIINDTLFSCCNIL